MMRPCDRIRTNRIRNSGIMVRGVLVRNADEVMFGLSYAGKTRPVVMVRDSLFGWRIEITADAADELMTWMGSLHQHVWRRQRNTLEKRLKAYLEDDVVAAALEGGDMLGALTAIRRVSAAAQGPAANTAHLRAMRGTQSAA